MIGKHDRLDGWKAIAGFFGRERTTVIRWARGRGMPVHALPGGKTRTVYALVNELEAWARSQDQLRTHVEPVEEAMAEPPFQTTAMPVQNVPLRRWFWLASGAAIVSALTIPVSKPKPSVSTAPLPRANQTSPANHELPADPTASALFLQARDDWAERSADSLARSVMEFQRVVRREPRFAPAFAALADSYLLAGEVGSLPVGVAFDGAEHAAQEALQLEPHLAAAHRAMGYIQYWWKHRPAAAGLEFREAIRLDPDAAQTHFWYANILADNGEEGSAMREFDRARLAEPGSDQIGADYAWALWIFGREDEAVARLRAIVANRPDNEEAQDCLGTIALAQGNYPAYLQALRKEAQLRREPALTAQVQAVENAFSHGGGKALLVSALLLEMANQEEAPYPNHSLAAFYAGLAGDRPKLMQILNMARAGNERWGSAGYMRSIRSKMKADTTVMAALIHLSAPPVEGPSRIAN